MVAGSTLQTMKAIKNKLLRLKLNRFVQKTTPHICKFNQIKWGKVFSRLLFTLGQGMLGYTGN